MLTTSKVGPGERALAPCSKRTAVIAVIDRTTHGSPCRTPITSGTKPTNKLVTADSWNRRPMWRGRYVRLSRG